MKPSPFTYFAPETLDEALLLLEEHGYDAKPLAGGQSLVPAMNFRLAQPGVLVDLNRLSPLFGIREEGDGTLYIGAMTRQRRVERSSVVAVRAPLVAEAMPHIAHPQIRNRGTFGGSLAHADPASELPAIAVALDMRLKAQGVNGERWIAAADFFLGLFETAMEPEELLTEIAIPPLPSRTGTSFAEVARRHGDYAMAGAAAVVTLAEDGTVANSRLVFLSIGDAPVEVRQVTELLRGERPTGEVIAAAIAEVEHNIDPLDDIHATAAYRRHLARVLARRTLTTAAERAAAGVQAGGRTGDDKQQ